MLELEKKDLHQFEMTSDYNKIKNWILDQAPTLDLLIKEAGLSYHVKNHKKRYYTYDVNSTIEELWLLNKGKDLCYDRPSIGFTYSLWYHGKRVNGVIDFFITLLLESKNIPDIEIFDLGAGTGAIQWAVGLVIEGMKYYGITTPLIKIVNIDSSPFMLEYNEHYLWNKFTSHYKSCKNIKIDYEINSWTNSEEKEYKNVWLCASYLFDHSENQELIANSFKDLASLYQPQKIILLSAWSKHQLVDSVGHLISTSGYTNNRGTFAREIFTGILPKVNNLRNDLNTQGLTFSGTCKWNADTWYGKALERTQVSLGLGFPLKFNIYQTAEKDRKSIKLSKEQEKAAEDTTKPTIIIGPAGCGKSVVLTEKIKNIVEKKGKEYDKSLNILLTTFNKDLVEYLGDWLEAILNKSKCERTYDNYNGNRSQHSYFTFEGASRPNISVMHFDVLPTKIGKINPMAIAPQYHNYEQYHKGLMEKAIKEYVQEAGVDIKKSGSILNADFLLEEYHRVIYGLQCITPNSYLSVQREGRGTTPKMNINSKRRQMAYVCMKKYKSFLNAANHESFIIRRRRFLNKLNTGNGQAKTFTHVLVDELQDCCKADYDIFYSLLRDNNNLTVTGDLAQSINIGTTAKVPRPQNEQMSRFQKIYLEGSFRLPFRITECIKILSEKIKDEFRKTGNTDVYEIIPYKGAPPGARPIIIYGNSKEELAFKTKEVFERYKSYDEKNITRIAIFEMDEELASELDKKNVNSSYNKIQKVKGMEKPFVLWSTKIHVDTDKEVDEFVYTILTRTTNILVIAIHDTMMTPYFDIIKSFDSERLIFWDKKSEEIYYSICSRQFKSSNEEDDSDDIEIHQKDLEGDNEGLI